MASEHPDQHFAGMQNAFRMIDSENIGAEAEPQTQPPAPPPAAGVAEGHPPPPQQQNHDEALLSCYRCTKKCFDLSSLYIHFSQVHPGEQFDSNMMQGHGHGGHGGGVHQQAYMHPPPPPQPHYGHPHYPGPPHHNGGHHLSSWNNNTGYHHHHPGYHPPPPDQYYQQQQQQHHHYPPFHHPAPPPGPPQSHLHPGASQPPHHPSPPAPSDFYNNGGGKKHSRPASPGENNKSEDLGPPPAKKPAGGGVGTVGKKKTVRLSIYCYKCEKHYGRIEVVKNHFTEWHTDSKFERSLIRDIRLVCGECKINFDTMREVQEHFANEHPGKVIDKPNIPPEFREAILSGNGINSKKSPPSSGLYPNNASGSIVVHLALHCYHCHFPFTDKIQLEQHYATHHAAEHGMFVETYVNRFGYVCVACQMAFGSYDSIIFHVKQVHPEATHNPLPPTGLAHQPSHLPDVEAVCRTFPLPVIPASQPSLPQQQQHQQQQQQMQQQDGQDKTSEDGDKERKQRKSSKSDDVRFALFCSLCNTTTTMKGNLKVHFSKQHPDANFEVKKVRFQCNLCELLELETGEDVKAHFASEHPDRTPHIPLVPPNLRSLIKGADPGGGSSAASAASTPTPPPASAASSTSDATPPPNAANQNQQNNPVPNPIQQQQQQPQHHHQQPPPPGPHGHHGGHGYHQQQPQPPFQGYPPPHHPPPHYPHLQQQNFNHGQDHYHQQQPHHHHYQFPITPPASPVKAVDQELPEDNQKKRKIIVGQTARKKSKIRHDLAVGNYQCYACDKQMLMKSMKHHFEVMHKDVSFDIEDGIEKLGWAKIKCYRCSLESWRLNNIEKHFELAHSNEPFFPGNLRRDDLDLEVVADEAEDEVVEPVNIVEDHEQIEKEDGGEDNTSKKCYGYRCNLCYFSCNTVNDFKRHFTESNNVNSSPHKNVVSQSYECTLCDKRTDSILDLAIHAGESGHHDSDKNKSGNNGEAVANESFLKEAMQLA